MSVLPAAAADRLERHINEADPQGLDANYIAAVGDPNYRTAFGKLMMDPQTGHLRFSPAEVEAVRRASQAEAQRSLNVTTGSAGAFAIPISLDPSIIMTGTGVLNPLRDLCSVETISSTTWKGVGDRGGDFLGRPKAELSTVVSTTTTASKIMIGGDLKTGYRIVDRIGGTIEIIPHLFGAAQGQLPTGQRGAYFYWRVGGGVVAPNALRYLEVL